MDRSSPTLFPSFVILTAFAGVAALPPKPAEAQMVTAAYGPYVLERQLRDRWVHEGQHPDFVPYTNVPGSVGLRSSISLWGDGSRRLDLDMNGREVTLTLDLRNRFERLRREGGYRSVSRYEDIREQAESRRRAVTGRGAKLSLPESTFWEVSFPVPEVPLADGVTWSDTLSFATTAEGMWERLEGIWQHRVVGDTAVNGRSLPLVQTQADIRYRAFELVDDPATDTLFHIMRDVSGRMHGRAAVDTAVGVRAAGTDSTLLTGTAVLRMGDGPPLVSGIRYDRERIWTLHDSTAWAEHQDSLREERRRRDTGMLGLPRTALQERLLSGDAAVVDSVIDVWRETDDPSLRTTLGYALAQTDARASDGTLAEETLRRLRLAAGDTAGLIADSLSGLGRRLEFSLDLLRRIDDPGSLWRLGILPRFVYVNLADQLLHATPILQPDSAQWLCAPEVCAAAIAMLENAAEPRLRDAALVGAFARDPARWYDRVLARADSGSAMARTAAQLGAGVGATWAASPNAPMPDPGAEWRDWLGWMGGEVRFQGSHVDALRMYAARTGRDPLDELLGEWPAAGDTARLVIGTILRGMDALPDPTAAEMRAALLSYSEMDRTLARSQIDGLVRLNGVPAPDSLALSLVRPLLDSVASGGQAPWRSPQGARSTNWSTVSGFHGITDVPVFVLDENLPTELASTLPADFTLITQAEWDARPRRAGGVLISVQPVLVWGDFATLHLSWRVYLRRAADEAASGYAGGGSYVLLRTDQGWRIVSELAWIT